MLKRVAESFLAYLRTIAQAEAQAEAQHLPGLAQAMEELSPEERAQWAPFLEALHRGDAPLPPDGGFTLVRESSPTSWGELLVTTP